MKMTPLANRTPGSGGRGTGMAVAIGEEAQPASGARSIGSVGRGGG